MTKVICNYAEKCRTRCQIHGTPHESTPECDNVVCRYVPVDVYCESLISQENIIKIDNGLGVEIEAHQITLYDVRAYSPQPITTLSNEQLAAINEKLIGALG